MGAIGLYRFFKVASPQQMAALLLASVTVVLLVAVFFMALTGRLPAAIALLVALYPLAKGFASHNRENSGDAAEAAYKGHKRRRKAPAPQMGYKEALEVLGLSGSPCDEDVVAAHKRLIRKVHPDQEGSAWLAAQINTARDILLEKSND